MRPETRVQRCVFHVFSQVRRCTTTRPKTQAGVDPHALARDLTRIETSLMAAEWLARFQRWCETYEEFLRERGEDGRRFEHERLRKARKAPVELRNAGTLFAYLDDELTEEGDVPATSNRTRTSTAG